MTSDEEYAIYERKRKRTLLLTSPLWIVPAILTITFQLVANMIATLSDLCAYVAETLSRNSL